MATTDDMKRRSDIIAWLSGLTAPELFDFIQDFTARTGAPVPSVGIAPQCEDSVAQPGPAPPSYMVTMKERGPNAIRVLHAVRELTGIGLVEVVNLIDTPGATVADEVDLDVATAIKERLESEGATVEVTRV